MRLAAVSMAAARRLLDLSLIALIAGVVFTLVLVRAVPAVTEGAVLVVGGGSMAPALPPGAAIVAVPVAADDLRAGDIVSLRVGPGRAIFTHRITDILPRSDGPWIRTKGDANQTPDPSIVRASVVIGRVEAVLPIAGYAISLLSMPAGAVFVAGLAACLFLGAWILESLELERSGRGGRPTGPAGRLAHVGSEAPR